MQNNNSNNNNKLQDVAYYVGLHTFILKIEIGFIVQFNHAIQSSTVSLVITVQ